MTVEWFVEQAGLEPPQVGPLLRDFRAKRAELAKRAEDRP